MGSRPGERQYDFYTPYGDEAVLLYFPRVLPTFSLRRVYLIHGWA
ncbi:hypothetical protein [Dickeya lacustris]|uniref:Uncharacterized protein n=1 Tax=Dickeya lacustris TaxID=2259638 RepID=A0ABY8G9I7_9GAMM|nr:hypothetical protein [Dickeya lacustris]WFN56587.1 hypothetical protein O1Q98_04670 [Dickeya lacustris]